MAKTGTKRAPRKQPVPTEGDLVHDTSSNQPPAETSFELKLDDLELEAANWLDDEPLSSQEQADQLTALVDAANKLAAEIEDARKTEKEPFLTAGREVDAKYKPLGERAEKQLRKLKNKVGEWLKLVRADKERREREAAEEARAAEQRLREEHERNRKSSNIADDAALAAAEEEAKQKRIAAAMVKRETVTASGGNTQVKLRKVWVVNIVERRELLSHYLKMSANGHSTFADDMQELLYKHARADVRASVRSLPGCRIWAEDQPV